MRTRIAVSLISRCAVIFAAVPVHAQLFGAERLGDRAARCVRGEVAACREGGEAVRKATTEWPLARGWFDAACAKGDVESCATVADGDVAVLTAQTYKGLRADAVVGLDPVGALRRACDLGRADACRQLADAFGTCDWSHRASLATGAPDPALGKSMRARASVLSQAACLKDDGPACVWLALGALAGCDQPRDAAVAARWLTRAVELGASGASSCLDLLDLVPAPATAPVESLAARAVRVSSEAKPWKDYRFEAKMLVDGDVATSWQPAHNDKGGVGSWVVVEFDAFPTLTGLSLANGFQRTDALGDLFAQNNRLTSLKVTFDNGDSEALSIDPNRRGLVTLQFAKPHASAWLWIEVASIAPGSKWKDLAISELHVLGRQRPAAVRALCAYYGTDELETDCVARPELNAPAVCAAVNAVQLPTSASELQKQADAQKKLCATPGTPGSASACMALARAAQDKGAAPAVLRPLLEAACRGGDSDGCVELGCHPFTDAGWDGMSAPGICQRLCDGGNSGACLGITFKLATGQVGKLGIAANDPKMNALLAKVGKRCSSAQECVHLANGSAQDYGMLRLDAFFDEVAFLRRACDLGAADGCVRLANAYDLDVWSEAKELAASAYARGCELGNAGACDAAADASSQGADTWRARAEALQTKACDGGDFQACMQLVARLDGAGVSRAGDKAKQRAQVEAWYDKRCDQGDSRACLEGGRYIADSSGGTDARSKAMRQRAVVQAVGRCAAFEGPCEPVCEAVRSLGPEPDGDDYVNGTPEGEATFREAAKLTSGLSANQLLSVCETYDAVRPPPEHSRN